MRSNDTIVARDVAAEVEFGVYIFPRGVLELSRNDSVGDRNILSRLAEAFSTKDKLSVHGSEEVVEVYGGRNPSLPIVFPAFGSEDALLDGSLTERVGERHCAGKYMVC